MFQTSYIELSESAIKNNIEFIQNYLGENITFSAVVKGNAYGHGIENYCPLAYKFGVRHFSVFSACEALKVTQALEGKNYTVMIMGQIDNEELIWAIENKVEFYIFEQDRLNQAILAAQKIGQKALIHVELETGMNRTGISQKEFASTFEKIANNQHALEVKGICTHFAGAENIANYKRVKDQISRFKRFESKLKDYNWLHAQKHLASSAATIRYPNTRHDLVRIGIWQFGFFPTQETFVHYCTKHKTSENPMLPVLSWKSKVMDIKTVKAGEFIGYGTSYFTNHTTTIALIPVGYSFGYSRSLSNRGKVLINGARFAVIGTVNMSMLAVDITMDTSIQKGDEVVLIGKQGNQELSVSSFSDFSQLINYELLARLPQDIPRIVTK